MKYDKGTIFLKYKYENKLKIYIVLLIKSVISKYTDKYL